MGTDAHVSTDEQPQHPVELDSYQISKFEVTWAQYKIFIEKGGYSNRNSDLNGYWSRVGANNSYMERWVIDQVPNRTLEAPMFTNQRDDYPVVGVSYWEAEAFCHFVGGRLPTEAEWEKAAAWGNGVLSPNLYPWGNTASRDLPANGWNTETEGFSDLLPVDDASHAGDVSRYGVYGMGGNVQEWVADFYDPGYYLESFQKNLSNPLNLISRRWDYQEAVGSYLPIDLVVRGGHFLQNTMDYEKFRCSKRYQENLFARRNNLGFRVVWDLQPEREATPVQREALPGAAIRVNAGNYIIGTTQGMPSQVGPNYWEHPQHGICLSNPFYIGMYEVTWGEYKRYMEVGGYGDPTGARPAWWSESGWRWRTRPPCSGGLYPVSAPDLLGQFRPNLGYDNSRSLWKGPWLASGLFSSPPDDHPVMGISWYEAEAYCKFVGGRLPLEVEWEIAASWNPDFQKSAHYPWGYTDTYREELTLCNSDVDPKYPGQQTSPVGMYPEGRSPLGCYDMAGNVFEWTADYANASSYAEHESVCGGNITTPSWLRTPAPIPSCEPNYTPIPYYMVKRGGGFDTLFDGALSQRSRTRGPSDGSQSFRNYTFGVRVVWDRDPVDIINAQLVRPKQEPGISTGDKSFTVFPPRYFHSVSMNTKADSLSFQGIMDVGDKEDWYRISGPPGMMVTVDLDAHSIQSPLDAVVEIWHDPYPLPVRIIDDCRQLLRSGFYSYELDPPVFHHRIPSEGYFWLNVKPWHWPAEGSQAAVPYGERCWYGVDYVYRISFSSLSGLSVLPTPRGTIGNPTPTPDFDLWPNTADGFIDARDLLQLLESNQSDNPQPASNPGIQLFNFSKYWQK